MAVPGHRGSHWSSLGLQVLGSAGAGRPREQGPAHTALLIILFSPIPHILDPTYVKAGGSKRNQPQSLDSALIWVAPNSL